MDALGVCPKKLQFCPSCKRSVLTIGRVVPNPDGTLYHGTWIKTLECSSCSRNWHVCTECHDMRNHLKDNTQLRRHWRVFHQFDYAEKTVADRRNNYKVEYNVLKKREREQQHSESSESSETSSSCSTQQEEKVHLDNDESQLLCTLLEDGGNEQYTDFDVDFENENIYEDPFDEGCPVDGEQHIYQPVDLPMDLEIDFIPPTTNIKCEDFPCTEARSFDSIKTIRYFENELQEGLGGGGRQLVADSFYASSGKKGNELDEEDVEICLQMALLVNSLSTRQNVLLSTFLKLYLNKMDTVTAARNKYWENQKSNWFCPRCRCSTCGEKMNPKSCFTQTTISIPLMPPIPRNMNRLRSVVINGKNSFTQMLPIPEIRLLGEHAYVLPSECIKRFLAGGSIPLYFDTKTVPPSYSSPKDTPRGVEISKKLEKSVGYTGRGLRHLPISFMEWKDDCEASKSNKKSKKGSLWVWTMTIITAQDGPDSPDPTFPIAIGYKSESHNEVERVIGEDFKHMAEHKVLSFLGGSRNRGPEEITFSAQMFLSLGDQPERRGGNSLMGGNSRSHARWRHACDHSQLVGVIPACNECMELMRRFDSCKIENNVMEWKQECTKCTNWMIRGLNDNMLTYKPRAGYPNGYLLGGEKDVSGLGRVNPIELTYESLTKVVNVTHSNVEEGIWTTVEGTNYLKENGINAELCTSIIVQAKNCSILKTAFENAETDEGEWAEAMEENQSNPEKYSKAKKPAVWQRDLPLSLYVDTPMHLLFLGVVKAVFIYVGVWSSRCGRRPAFQVIAKNRLKQLEALKLSWLTFQVDSFDTWAGWVSEKFASLSRVALWIYGPLMLIDDVPPFVPPPNRQPKDWRLEDFKKWLQIRGLPVSGGKEELKTSVLGYLSLPIGDRPSPLPPSYGCAEGVLTMIRSMVVVLTTIMQPVVDGEGYREILQLRTRLFLNAVEEFEKPLRKKKDDKIKLEALTKEKERQEVEREERISGKKKSKVKRKKKAAPSLSLPVWLDKYNFLSMLNLPDIIRHFGSPRNYFEGKYLGERFVQDVKNTKERCPPQKVVAVLLQKLHEGKAIETLARCQSTKLQTMRSTESGNRKDSKRKEILRNSKVYSCIEDAKYAFQSKQVLSMVESVENGFGILFYENGSNRGKIWVREVERMDLLHSELHGIRYWRWNLVSGRDVLLNDCTIVDFVVLLPKPGVGSEFVPGEYTMVTKEWSPAMLDHFEYSKVGMHEEEKKMKENGMI